MRNILKIQTINKKRQSFEIRNKYLFNSLLLLYILYFNKLQGSFQHKFIINNVFFFIEF